MPNSPMALWLAATVGWLFTGYYTLASTRADDVAPFWRSPIVQAGGVLIAAASTVAVFFAHRWWWGVAVFLTAPNMAALAILAMTRHD